MARNTADPVLAKSLEEAFRAYHKGMTSKDKADHQKALLAWLGKKDDVTTLFAKYPAADLYTFVLNTTLEGDAEEYANREKESGEIKSIEAIDLRSSAGAGYRMSAVERVTPADVPIYALRIGYEEELNPTSIAPVFFVNGRWAWMPGLEKMVPLWPEPEKK